MSLKYGRTAALAMCLLAATASAHAVEALERYARIQALSAPGKDLDIYDPGISSPKSVAFSSDGSKLYINSLEGEQTLVYSFPQLKPLKQITYRFGKANNALFQGNESTVFGYKYRGYAGPDYNTFSGKPVEMAFSHKGRYLWVPFYRRSFDPRAVSPSAIAIIDTRNDTMVRVMPTGPLPKFVAVSPDSRWVAVTHWGDNTIGLIDTRAESPESFAYARHLVVGSRLNLDSVSGDRDKNCGFCLRGTVFVEDGKTLLVARMGGGGIAGFDVASGSYLGTVSNIVTNPRHIVVSDDQQMLYVSGNQSGQIGRYSLPDILARLKQAKGQVVANRPGEVLNVGKGARTIVLNHRNDELYAAINNQSKLIRINLSKWTIDATVSVDPFAVGLAISPDDRTIVTTSQGRTGLGGGNSVGLYRAKAD
jgi:DNA-binding beta-propeller fold protein YncE